MNSYDAGELVRLTATFANSAGTPTNPTAVTLTVRDPMGGVSTPSPSSDGSGVYHYDLALTTTGTYAYRWEGTGTVTTADEAQLYVEPRLT